jgi:hypothetical protein
MRFHVHGTAPSGIEHPRRNCEEQAIAELDEVTIFGVTPKAPHDMAFMVEERMMLVADSYGR